MNKLNEHFNKFNSNGFRIEEKLIKEGVDVKQTQMQVNRVGDMFDNLLDLERGIKELFKGKENKILASFSNGGEEFQKILGWVLDNYNQAEKISKKVLELRKIVLDLEHEMKF